MSEMANALRMLQGRFSTAIHRIDYPIHKGQPNQLHGHYGFVGSIPAACYDHVNQRSKYWPTEQEAIDAAIAAGATYIQRLDCSRVALPVAQEGGRK